MTRNVPYRILPDDRIFVSAAIDGGQGKTERFKPLAVIRALDVGERVLNHVEENPGLSTR